jgi:lactate permease
VYRPIVDTVNHSLGLSAFVAALPLLLLFVLLGVFKVRSHWAALASLAAALLVAVWAYQMPVGQALDSALEGAAFGIFPIIWIVVNAIWIYNMTVATGDFEVLRRAFGLVSSDLRIQAVIVAFCFGALLEALAGFGTPVAITSVMLIALGFRPLKAASVALIANTAPVAFGAMAVPITSLAKVTGLSAHELGATVGRQTPILALFVPLVLVFVVDGRRGIRQAWPAALVGGVGFAVGQFLCSNFFSLELTDIIAALLSAGSIVLLLRFWRPAHIVAVEAVTEPGAPTGPPSRREILRAFAPYIIIIAVFSLAQIRAVQQLLARGIVQFSWPGLHVLSPAGKPVSSATFKFDWLPAGGTLLLLTGLLTALVLGIRARGAVGAYGQTLRQLGWAILTVATVLALAYVLNLSGQTSTIGSWMAGSGAWFALLSPILGWLGVAVTGSDTSSNVLFGTLQVAAAKGSGLHPMLMAAANSSGGVLGKMLSPQNLAIAAAATGLSKREGELFRAVLWWSLLFLLGMSLIVFLQSALGM